MKKYEIITIDSSGCVWPWEDDKERSVVIEADSIKEAEDKFFAQLSSEFEDVAAEYFAHELFDWEIYTELHTYVIWEG